MEKIKKFFEFLNTDLSLFIPLRYVDISNILGCSVEEVLEFENFLEDNIKPGEKFHGSIDTGHQEEEEYNVDRIDNERDYLNMWEVYQDSKKPHFTDKSHNDLGL